MTIKYLLIKPFKLSMCSPHKVYKYRRISFTGTIVIHASLCLLLIC
nr:MAG TPA: hypothetical protein [Caudoviricetes sp.]